MKHATTIYEIARDLFRVSIYVPDFDGQFNHFLVRDEEPLLFAGYPAIMGLQLPYFRDPELARRARITAESVETKKSPTPAGVGDAECAV